MSCIDINQELELRFYNEINQILKCGFSNDEGYTQDQYKIIKKIRTEFPEATPDDVVFLLPTEDDNNFVEALEYKKRFSEVPDGEIFTLMACLKCDPDCNAIKFLDKYSLYKNPDGPEADLQTAIKIDILRKTFPLASEETLREAVTAPIKDCIKTCLLLKEVFENKTLSQILGFLRDYPNVDINTAFRIKDKLPKLRLRDIAGILQKCSNLDVNYNLRIDKKFKEIEEGLKNVKPKVSHSEIAEALLRYPVLNVSRVVYLKIRMPQEELVDLAGMLNQNPETDFDYTIAVYDLSKKINLTKEKNLPKEEKLPKELYLPSAFNFVRAHSDLNLEEFKTHMDTSKNRLITERG